MAKAAEWISAAGQKIGERDFLAAVANSGLSPLLLTALPNPAVVMRHSNHGKARKKASM